MNKITRTIVSAALALVPLSAMAADKKGDAEAGKKKYQELCASCHGVGGKGDGAAAAALNPKPADHTDPAKMCDLADDALFKIVKEGGVAVGKSPLMPAWGAQLKTDDEVWNLARFVRSLHEKGCKPKTGGKREDKK